jgi:hypothetical protein
MAPLKIPILNLVSGGRRVRPSLGRVEKYEPCISNAIPEHHSVCINIRPSDVTSPEGVC